MRLKKRIVGLGLAMSLMLSGLYIAPEKVRAEVENENTRKVESISRGTVIAAKSSGKKVKMPEKAVDGSRIIYTSNSDVYTISADTDGEYIYYTVHSAMFDGIENYALDYAFKRSIKTGKETAVKLGHSIRVYKDFILDVSTIGSAVEYNDISKTDKNGKRKELAMGYSPILVGNSIYYIAEKKVKVDYDEYTGEPIGIYKMDINGKNKKPVKKGVIGQLGVSGKNIYYSDSSFENQETADKWYNLKTGKLEKNVIPSYLYDPISKTKVTFNKNEVKAGKYKDGKWEYKTILKYKSVDDYSGIVAARVYGSKILVQIQTGEAPNFKIYIMDLNGKNKKLIRTGQTVS